MPRRGRGAAIARCPVSFKEKMMELDEFCGVYALMVAAVVDRTDGKCGDLMDGELSGLVDHGLERYAGRATYINYGHD